MSWGLHSIPVSSELLKAEIGVLHSDCQTMIIDQSESESRLVSRYVAPCVFVNESTGFCSCVDYVDSGTSSVVVRFSRVLLLRCDAFVSASPNGRLTEACEKHTNISARHCPNTELRLTCCFSCQLRRSSQLISVHAPLESRALEGVPRSYFPILLFLTEHRRTRNS